jgi:hypothetical protein
MVLIFSVGFVSLGRAQLNCGYFYVGRMTCIPQHKERRCRVEDGGFEVISISTRNGNKKAAASGKLVCSGQQIKHQLDRLSGWDGL